jgi:hypothetical protein
MELFFESSPIPFFNISGFRGGVQGSMPLNSKKKEITGTYRIPILYTFIMTV